MATRNFWWHRRAIAAQSQKVERCACVLLEREWLCTIDCSVACHDAVRAVHADESAEEVGDTGGYAIPEDGVKGVGGENPRGLTTDGVAVEQEGG